MADKTYNPSIDLLESGSTSVASDRARRISSLHRTVSDLTREQNRKRLQQSVEISGLAKHQQKMMQQLELERDVFMSDTASAHSGILKNLGRTIFKLSEGVASITKNTASATANAINQYGKAISEDVSINKTNTIAMALARATPLFGYFAGKFMETDVFQGAARKIKEKVGSAFQQGLSGVGNFFRSGKNRKERDEENGTVAEIKALRESFEREGIPHLQKGGFINKGGMVEVHAAEVVTPIDKLLKHIRDTQSADIAEKLDSTLQIMSQDMIRMETIVVQREKATTNILETFIKEFREAREYEEENFQDRLLKGVLELKVALVGMTSRFEIAWQRALLQHPAIAKMLVLTDMLKSVTITPLKFLFSRRGGYSGEVQKATSTNNVFLKITNVLGLIYTGMMPKLNNIEKYTHILAEAVTKTKVEGVEAMPEYTMFHKIKGFFTSRKKRGKGEGGDGTSGGGLFDFIMNSIGLDMDVLKEAGINSFADFKHPTKILEKMGITKKSVIRKFYADPKQKLTGLGITKEKTKDSLKGMASNIAKLTKMKQAQEKREGPHSPSMAQNIATTAKASEEQLSFSQKMYKKVKNLGGDIWHIMMFIGSMLVNAITSVGSMIGNVLGGVLNLLGLGGILRKGKGLIGGLSRKSSVMARRKMGRTGRLSMGKISKKSSGMLGKVSKYAKGASAKGGTKLGKIALGGAKIGGAMFGGALALGSMGWDAISVMINPEGFVQSRLISGISAFFGGKDSGTSGAISGALKGGAIGATIGSIFPVVGTAIGGGIGAALGGILGFVGGKDIAKLLEAILKPIKSVFSGIWILVKDLANPFIEAGKEVFKEISSLFSVLMFPFKALWEGLQSFGIIVKYLFKKLDISKFLDFKENGFLKPIIQFFEIIDSFTKYLFGGLHDLLGGEKVQKIAKDMIANLFFPITGLIKGIRWIGDYLVQNLTKIPYVGTFFKEAFQVMKDIHTGDLSNKLEKALNIGNNPILNEAESPKDISDIVNEAFAKGFVEDIKQLDVRRKVFDTSTTLEKYSELNNNLAKQVDKSGQNTAKAIITTNNTANSVTSTSSSNTNNNGGNGGGNGGYFMGSEAAYDLTHCNQS